MIRLDLAHEDGRWICSAHGAAPNTFGAPPVELGAAEPVELTLSRLLAEYTELMRPRRNKRGQLVFINLQKRLLSSIEAFWRTLQLHAENLGLDQEAAADAQLSLSGSAGDEDEYGIDDEAAEESSGAEVAAASRRLAAPGDHARVLLAEMLRLARSARHLPDAKARALLSWVRHTQCPGAIPGRDASGGEVHGRGAATEWRADTVRAELETERADLRKLKTEIDDAERILEASRKLLELDPDLLRETVDAGLEMAGAAPLRPSPPTPLPSPPATRERGATAHPPASAGSTDPPAFDVPTTRSSPSPRPGGKAVARTTSGPSPKPPSARRATVSTASSASCHRKAIPSPESRIEPAPASPPPRRTTSRLSGRTSATKPTPAFTKPSASSPTAPPPNPPTSVASCRVSAEPSAKPWRSCRSSSSR